jgi:hypothetical protein
VLTDAEANVAASPVRRVKVLVAIDVVERRTVKIGTATDERRNGDGERLKDIAAGLAGRDLRIRRELRNQLEEIGREQVLEGVREFLVTLRMRCLPHLVQAQPLKVRIHELLLVGFEESARLGRDKEVLTFRKSESFPRGINELRAAFTVRLGRARYFGDALADDGAGDDQLRLCRH